MQKMKKILIVVAIGLSLFAVVNGVLYISATYPADEVSEFCVENTNVDAVKFYPSSISPLEGYMFWVSVNENDVQQQEMFIFKKDFLWGIFDFDRYRLVQQVVGGEGQIVSSVRFEAQTRAADEETKVVLFFSANPEKITYYKIYFQENGVRGELSGAVSQEKPFVVGITEVGNHDYISRVYEGAEFYDEEYQSLEIEE